MFKFYFVRAEENHQIITQSFSASWFSEVRVGGLTLHQVRLVK